MSILVIIVTLIILIIIGVILYIKLKPKSSDEVITEKSSFITSESSTTPKPTIAPISSVDCVLSEWSACDTNGKQTRTIKTSGTGLACGDLTQSCTTPAHVLSCEEAKSEYLKDNVDVKNSGMDAWDHYTNHGKTENRKWKGSECNSPPTYKDLANNTLNLGQAIECSGTDTLAGAGTIYRYDGTNKLRAYPTPAIASSWDTNWTSRVAIDCNTFTRGDNMTAKVI